MYKQKICTTATAIDFYANVLACERFLSNDNTSWTCFPIYILRAIEIKLCAHGR